MNIYSNKLICSLLAQLHIIIWLEFTLVVPCMPYLLGLAFVRSVGGGCNAEVLAYGELAMHLLNTSFCLYYVYWTIPLLN